VFDAIFRFLFKYPSVVFEQGDLVFAASRSMTTAIVVGIALAVAALITYRSITNLGTRKDQLALVGLRLALLGVLLFCLFRPVLLLTAAVPQQNFLGILVDDSKSMLIADRGGEPRSTFVQQQFGEGGALLSALSERFALRFFRFSSSADRLPQTTDLTYEGAATRLGPALERARDELGGLPLAGLVMVTDGADTSDQTLDEPIAALKARSIPVFPVGLGEERFERDIQVSRVEAPRTILKGTTIAVDVVISHTGYSGSTIPVQVEDDGRIVSSQEVTLPRDGEATTVRVSFTASEEGARLFRFRVPSQTDEQVTQNNTRDSLIEVVNRRERVLFFEGEPRPEVAFIRRAVQDDPNLQVVFIVRTAEEKYWRGDVESPDELASGFPRTRDELFAYRSIILGSVEAAAFTPEQLRMLADFVSKRGGGLLMLGGRRAFAEGGWAGTPVAEVLPVDFDEAASTENGGYFSHLTVRPTRAGATSPVVQLADDEEASTARWTELPAVSAVNEIRRVKPGATVLLTGTDDNREEQVVLAYQRYGRGKAFALSIQDSWIWKMDVMMAVDDMTHVTFWRRLVRWLVDGVPDHVSLTTSTDRVDPGEPMRLTAEVVDPAFVEVNDAQVVAEVTSPSGKTMSVPLEWSVTRDGEYQGSFVPDEQGLYELRATAVRSAAETGQETNLGSSVMHARVAAGDSEYFDAAMRSSLLNRLAEETGGRFFTAATASALPEAISFNGRGVTVVEERDLWDMPAALILILALIAAEWGYRRKRGLA
jgi:uncharacterized membrane protein